MSTSKKTTLPTIDQLTRITSAKGKLYLALKDGKKHSIVSIKAMLRKAGIEGSIYGVVYGLNRLLYWYMEKQILIVDRFEKTGTLQMVAYKPEPVVKTKATSKTKVAKSSKSKSTKTAKSSKTTPVVAEHKEVVAA